MTTITRDCCGWMVLGDEVKLACQSQVLQLHQEIDTMQSDRRYRASDVKRVIERIGLGLIASQNGKRSLRDLRGKATLVRNLLREWNHQSLMRYTHPDDKRVDTHSFIHVTEQLRMIDGTGVSLTKAAHDLLVLYIRRGGRNARMRSFLVQLKLRMKETNLRITWSRPTAR